MKYINKQDVVEMFHQINPNNRCKTYVVGKTHNYILVKAVNIGYCRSIVYLTKGGPISFFSTDLIDNISKGRDLVQILLKKRSAVNIRMQKYRTAIHTHLEKVDVINKRFEVLQEKLRKEWRDEISLLEEDKVEASRRFAEYQLQLNNIDHKLEKYQIKSANLTVDRWSLDPDLYYEK